MLVNVYGSKELFVNEYRTLLADRLLTQYVCDTEKEIRYLELLKLRFGDSQLHYCEVSATWAYFLTSDCPILTSALGHKHVSETKIH